MQSKDNEIYCAQSFVHSLCSGDSELSQLYWSLQVGLNQYTEKKIAASGDVNKCIGPETKFQSRTNGLLVSLLKDFLLLQDK